MSDKVAVIASVLKPVDDTRMYEKLGLSILESNKYRVNIIGFGAKKPPSCAGITFHGLYQGQRSGFSRLLASWRFLGKLIDLRPELVIVCTPELLLPAILYKVIYGGRLWYDVQENYQLNISYQSAYPTLLKPILRTMLWLIEYGTRPFVDQYLLAEKGYAKELNFIAPDSLVLENKFVPVPAASGNQQPSIADQVKLVFTGTCSRENGILQAVSLAETLLKNQYPVSLDIVGQVPDATILQEIKRLIEVYGPKFFRLVGDGQLVPHQTIMEYAARSDFGLVAHQPNPSNQHCIPTKIYEYLGLGVPMLLQDHPWWKSVVDPYQAALILDFNHLQTDHLWRQMKNRRFYPVQPGPEILWQTEARKLTRLL